MAELQWAALTEADVPELQALAQACLDHDGGFPTLAAEASVRGLFLSGASIGGRDELGDLVAVAGFSRDAKSRLVASGLVHPAMRRQGLGEELVAWCREHADGETVRVVAETMSPEAESLYAASGLRRTIAETIMRHPMDHISRIPLPEGLRTLPYREDTAGAFHAAYAASFAERPGFPDTPADEWHRLLAADPEFRPDDSRVALDPDGAPAGFVILSGVWLDQVGVVPQWRGQRLGAHLVVRTLSVVRRERAEFTWLAVTVDNPARALYERLGFESYGLRARYRER